jgi:NADH-quinone oxidoreductase subunit J
MDFNIIMYIVFGILAVAGAIALFLARHPIRGALGLLGTMLSLAGMYAILNAHAIAAFQVIIYAGAVIVLIVYIVMLLDIRTADFTNPFANFVKWGAPLVVILLGIFLMKVSEIKIDWLRFNPFGEALPEDYGAVAPLGQDLLGKYLFSFEYVSTILFAAIVAVIALVQLDWKGRKKHES